MCSKKYNTTTHVFDFEFEFEFEFEFDLFNCPFMTWSVVIGHWFVC